MDYESLLKRVRDTRSQDAARQLLVEAQQRQDKTAARSCWQVLYPQRLRAWQALKAVIRALGGEHPQEEDVAPTTTQMLQYEVTARVLIEACQKDASDPLALDMVAFALTLLESPTDAQERMPENVSALSERLDLALLGEPDVVLDTLRQSS